MFLHNKIFIVDCLVRLPHAELKWTNIFVSTGQNWLSCKYIYCWTNPNKTLAVCTPHVWRDADRKLNCSSINHHGQNIDDTIKFISLFLMVSLSTEATHGGEYTLLYFMRISFFPVVTIQLKTDWELWYNADAGAGIRPFVLDECVQSGSTLATNLTLVPTVPQVGGVIEETIPRAGESIPSVADRLTFKMSCILFSGTTCNPSQATINCSRYVFVELPP